MPTPDDFVPDVKIPIGTSGRLSATITEREIPDDFKPDDFIPDVSTIDATPGGHWEQTGFVTQWKPNKPVDINRRPDYAVTNALSLANEAVAGNMERGVNESSYLPDWAKGPINTFNRVASIPGRMFTEGLQEPDVIASLLAPIRAPKGLSPSPPPPPPPTIRGLLPEQAGPSGYNPNPYLATAEGRIQRQSLMTPQEEARMAGYEIDANGNPIGVPSERTGTAVDLQELRERERLARLNYTDFEHQGGVALDVPDRPLVAAPPTSGDTAFGFSQEANPDVSLGYPLDIVPNALRPRSTQAVLEAITPRSLAEPAPMPSEPVTFVSGERPGVVPQQEIPATPNLAGGTAAIKPSEPILPSAPKTIRVKADAARVSGLNVGNATIPRDTTPAVSQAVTEGVTKLATEAGQPSWLMQGIYEQLSRMGNAGKQIVYRVQQAAQHRAEYDAAWTEPLFKVGASLSKAEHANFGAYVEGRIPVPNDRVQAAVDAWNQAQNMMGDAAVSAGLHLKRGKEIIPFQKVEQGYWPHIPNERLTTDTIIDRLMAKGMSRYDAQTVAKRWDSTGEILIGPQHSRALESEFVYKDDFDAAIQHGRSMSKRVANHQDLGPLDVAGKGDQGIANLIEDTNDPKLAMRLAQRLVGRDARPSDQLMRGLNQARKWMSLTKLPGFSIPNVILGQTMNAHMALMSRHPVEAMMEVGKLFRSAYRDEIRAAGVFNSFNRSLVEELSGIDPFLIGAGEKINRSVAAAIGRSTVRTAFEDFKAGVNTKNADYFLRTLLSRDPATITEMTPELERFAAGRMAEVTQGLNNPGNLPYHWSAPVNNYGALAGQLSLIFKKVGFQVTKTVKDTMKVNPALAIPAWMALSQVAGEMVADVKSGLTGKPRPTDWRRIPENWANAHMLGLPWDLVASAQYSPSAALGTAVGPVFSGASELGWDAYKTTGNLIQGREDPFRELRQFGEKNIPLPARERLAKIFEGQ